MKRILDQLILITFLFVGVAAVSGFLFYQMNQAVTWVAHTQEVLYEQSDVYSNLQDMNLSSRGYAFTGAASVLKPYTIGKAQYPGSIERLGSLVQDSSSESEEVHRLKDAAAEFDSVTKSLIDSRSKVLIDDQMSQMDKIRASLTSLTNDEKQLLALRTRQADLYFKSGIGLIFIQVILGLVLLGTCKKTITNYTAEDRAKIGQLEQEIEQRIKTEIALKDTTSQLASSNTDLQQFAYVASHDLQEPLRAVAGFVTLIASKYKGQLDPEADVWINHTVEGAQRMRALINDLLLYARVESRGQELVKTDCNKALKQATKDLSVVIEETGAQITGGKLPIVLGEEGQLAQLFQNLIGNAIKFKKDGQPNVDIEATKKDGEWVFSVKDNAIGFDQEHAERIFVIFQRLQGRDEYKGTGIGLALCKKIVERHGGRIWAESTKGKGSTFFFTIPVMQGE